MNKRPKIIFYLLAKYLGLFEVAAFLTRKSLRILCYHGISKADEHVWQPGLFIRPESLKRRFQIMRKRKYPVLPLKEGVRLYKEGKLPHYATVITFDDGFENNYSLGLPIFKEFNFPVTIYVSSYHVEKQTPVFRLAVQYLFWKTNAKEVDLSVVDAHFRGMEKVSLLDLDKKHQATWKIINYGEKNLSDSGRVSLLKKLSVVLKEDYSRIDTMKMFHFMTSDELKKLDENGIEIGLHTHRHQLLISNEMADREIKDNKVYLENILGKNLENFCYPSGTWSQDLFPILKKHQISSSTTCDIGLNPQGSHYLSLKRYLDGESNSDIELEAELTGFAEILRSLFKRPSTVS